ncbi:MAG: nitroreductase, partial [Dehalococcoidales bacterium]|nr:nitroreductase [Dehalococcoidales bacterium]
TSGVSPASDIPQVGFAEPHTSRSRELGLRLYQVLGISREDREKRQEWTLQGQRFFDAPNALVFYLDEALGPWSLFDLGLFSQSVMLAALTFDLGTCTMAAVARYPLVLRRILGIPDNKKIVLGIAIGYPDWQHPANKLVSSREAMASFTKWHGL